MAEASRQGAKAATYANARIGKKMPAQGLCLQFVRENFGIPVGAHDAITAWNNAKVKHTSKPPTGIVVPVFFRTPSSHRHVAFYRGDGKVITTNGSNIELWSSIDAVASAFKGPFMGWTEDLNGYDLYDAPKPSTKIKADGVWDKDTTALFQKVLGTHSDGIVSDQPNANKAGNPGLTTGWDWVTSSKATGSQLIVAAQKRLGSNYKGKIDGLAGPEFFKGLQRHYGTTVDGKISNPSAVVTKLQQSLNSGKF
jgi:hypothetical protein